MPVAGTNVAAPAGVIVNVPVAITLPPAKSSIRTTFVAVVTRSIFSTKIVNVTTCPTLTSLSLPFLETDTSTFPNASLNAYAISVPNLNSRVCSPTVCTRLTSTLVSSQ